MPKSPLLLALVFSLTATLSGCGSSPRNNYYLLTAQQTAAPVGETPALGIGPIEIPGYLDRANLVYNQQGNKLQVSDSENWAEPLQNGIERVLALNLASLLNTQNVRIFPWNPQRGPNYGIKVNVLTLDANKDEATLTAEWLVYRPEGGETLIRRISHLQQTLTADAITPQQVAPAYSALLAQLSEIIAKAIEADIVVKGISDTQSN
jgi:uncharacterized lipoprotein YmbA